jgi:serine/threonine-protein kinase HipA
MSADLRVAQVSFKDAIAGRLEETARGGSRFAYAPDWSETIGCCLPVARREHEWQAGLHPFFQHLGAEGWLRGRQARLAHVAEDDDLGLLLRYGADCIGAVGVLPNAQEAPSDVPASEIATLGRTVSGVQRKLLVARDETSDVFRPAGRGGPAPYIAKFNSESHDALVHNENLSLRWVSAILGPNEVTKFQLGQVADLNEVALVVTRFDRTPEGAKLRAEDFAQILCKPRGADYNGKYESSYEEVAEIIRNHSVRPDIDLARFFRRLIVYVLVSNGDAHLKNFTLLERPEGLRLSPLYDVVNVGVYAGQGTSQQLALAMNGDFLTLEAVTRPVLTAFGERIGLSRATIASAFRDISKRVQQSWKVLPDAMGANPDSFGARYTTVVRSGCLRVLEA